MGHSDLDPAIHDRSPWNAGKKVGPKRPLKPRDIWAIRFYLDEHKRLRDRALFDLAKGDRRVVDRLPEKFVVSRSESEWLLTLLGARDLRYIFEGSADD